MKRRHGIPEPQRRRRGVVLIVVLGILALFSLVGVMFITTAQQAQQSAQALAETDLRRDPPQALLERAMLQVLVGSTSRGSSIGPHSLLEDMYGPPTLKVRLQSAPVALANGAFLGFSIDPSNTNYSGLFQRLDHLYAGRILTMTSGRLQGKSTRIVGWYPQSPDSPNGLWTLRMIPFDGMVNASGSLDVASLGPQQNDEFLINGHPFSGVELAPNRVVGDIATLKNTINPRLSAVRANWTGAAQGKQDNLTNPTRANEDYDAADFNNMHLAHVVSDPQNVRVLVPMPSYHRPDLLIVEAGTATPQGAETQQMASNRKVDELVATNPTEARKLILRPLPADHHEDFGKMNPFLFSAPYGASKAFPLGDHDVNSPKLNRPRYYWDVDNDNDGEPDSVWLDLGFPVTTDEQGRKFKPLFAIYVQSQDGKLNLNAHGQWNDESTGQAGDPFAGTSGHRAWTEFNAASAQQWRWQDAAAATASSWIPHGVGRSPASVDPTTFLSQTEFFFLLHGRMVEARPDSSPTEPSVASVQLAEPGRYGEPGMIQIPAFPPTPAAATQLATTQQLAPAYLPRPGRSFSSTGANAQNADDNFPGRDYTETNLTTAGTVGDVRSLSGYGSPVDLQGSGGVMIGPGGHPVFIKTQYDVGSGNYKVGRIANQKVSPIPTHEYVDDPHELNLYSNSTAFDQPFKQSDLEFLLRGADPDLQALHYPGNTVALFDSNLKASYSQTSSRSFKRYHLRHGSRLRHLLSHNVLTYASHRNLLTTDSWDVTTPVRPLAAVVYSKLKDAGVSNIETAINYLSDPRYPKGTSGSRKIVGPALPFEAALGVKMNLNRPWGVGVADNGVLGVVDYPGLTNQATAYGTVHADRNNDGDTTVGKDALAPQMYARQLFMLAMVCGEGTPVKATSTQNVASVLRLAQWAVNTVDFRDQDNIMTYFEVDLWPFTDEDGDGNPWDVDGLLDTDESGSGVQRKVVWGNELSPLLISENFAFHDVRTKDDNNDTGVKKKRTDTPPDPDLDQERRPEGNLIVELYSPRNPRVRGTFPTQSATAAGTNTWGTLSEDLYTNQPVTVNPTTALATSPDQDDPAVDDVQKNPGFAGLLDLGRAVEYNNRIDPVWRMAVVSDTGGVGVQGLLQQLAADPEYINLTATAGPREIERIVYFAPIPAGSESKVLAQNRTYSNHIGARLNASGQNVTVYDPSMQNALGVAQIQSKIFTSNVLLGAGRFAVVCPYRENEKQKGPSGQSNTANTPERSVYVGAGATVPEVQLMANSQSAYGGGFALTDSSGTPQTAYTALFKYGFGALSIGCAGKCYDGTWANDELLGLSVTEPRMDQYGNVYKQPTGTSPTTRNGKTIYDQYGPLLDKPSDQSNTTWINLSADGATGTPKDPNKILVLQRLANPLLPYHAACNPYIAVDAQDCRPQVFNSGVSNDINLPSSMQRGTTGSQNLWAYNSTITTATKAPFLTTHNFGMMNKAYDATFNAATLGTTMGSLRNLFGLSNSSATADFPWIVWNNRPFVNPFELMLVPASSAPMLSVEMSTVANPLASIQTVADQTFQYRWLMPFTLESWTAGSGGIIPDPPKNLYRLFEYVGLPTAFSGGEKLYMPTKFQAGGSFVADQYPFNAPFNRLPSYREPGRVNLNAILDASGATYEAVIGKMNVRDARFASTTGYTGTTWASGGNLTATWATLSQSIRGGSAEPQNLWALPSSATNILNLLKTPFRSHYYAMPVAPATPPTNAVQLSQSLFRKATTGANPLFDFNGTSAHTTKLDAARHPYYRFYTMQRLSQTTTPRSNVYAVWITMGNFEVEPVPAAVYTQYSNAGNLQGFYDIYPDSYRLKGELGWDTGEIKRRRAFFIVDRTIPVGFERGRANNAFDAVTLQRIIE